ncbi:MAG: sigma-70 family RNA polymerase sigma factor [Actinomycetota bacterium]
MIYLPGQTSSRARLLTAEEEQELAKTIEWGRDARDRAVSGCPQPDDEARVAAAAAARRSFMAANIGLVVKAARSFTVPPHVDREDLIQDGMLGLGTAVDRFDWRTGYRFSTYATWWIRQAIQRGLEHTATTIRIPAHRHGELRAALATDGDADRRSMSPQAAHLATVGTVDSLDRSIGEDGARLADLVASGSSGPDDTTITRFQHRQIHHHVNTLDPTSAAAVTQRFGLDGGEPATFAQIGRDLGVSTEAARRRVHRALAQLGQDLRPLAA